MKLKILITGFDPFNNETINPAFEAIKKLNSSYDDIEITKLEIPTSFSRSFETIKKEIAKGYDAVIMVGQAGGRKEISLEKVAINYIDAKICDNDQYLISHQVINPNGREAYFTTLPILHLQHLLEKNAIPVKISYTAGTFVCNYLMYKVLEYLSSSKIKAGFIHVPYCKEQVQNKDLPALDLNIITQSLEIIIRGIFEC